jgi:hypothetical protein
MTPALLLCLLLPADEARPTTLRYLKPAGDKFVLESEVTRETRGGAVYTSKTVRGTESLTLTVRRDEKGQTQGAEIVHDRAGAKKSAQVEWTGTGFRLKRDGVSEDLKAPRDAVITSAPDWSDIFELVPRYDRVKKGKQSFAGLWFHPSQPPLTPTFTVEHTGTDAVTRKGKEEALERFEVRIRASTNRVWAKPDGVVVKILPAGQRAVPVVLEGYEEATRGLK